MKKLYEAVVTSEGGRNGKVKSSDSLIDLKVSMPKSMGGLENHTNPEQLFAAGYAACFENAVIYVAKQKKHSGNGTKVTAYVALHSAAPGDLKLSVRLEVLLPEVDRVVAQEIIDEAHKTCPYSKATKGNIDVVISLLN